MATFPMDSQKKKRTSLRTRLALVFATLIVAVALVGVQAIRKVEDYRDARLAEARLGFQRYLAGAAWDDLDAATRLIGAGSHADLRSVQPSLNRALSRFRRDWQYATILGGDVHSAQRMQVTLAVFERELLALRRKAAASSMPPAAYLTGMRVLLREHRTRFARRSARLGVHAQDVPAQAFDAFQWWIAGFFALVAAATACLWVVVHFSVTKRLEKLHSTVAEFAIGNLDVTATPRGRDEIAQLGESFRDLAQRLREQFDAERQLREQLVVHERLAAVGELAAAVAHSLGNPLASIRALAQVGSPNADEPQRETFAEIVALVDRIDTHLDELLAYARDGQRELVQVDVNRVVENVVALLEPMSIARGARLTSRLAAAPVYVEADATDVERALLAVVENAIEASGGSQDVEIETWADDANVFVSVGDRGPGIDPQHGERIFDPFYSTKSRGRGLGLTVARRVAATLSGELTMSARNGGGTRVAFRFPRLQAATA